MGYWVPPGSDAAKSQAEILARRRTEAPEYDRESRKVVYMRAAWTAAMLFVVIVVFFSVGLGTGISQAYSHISSGGQATAGGSAQALNSSTGHGENVVFPSEMQIASIYGTTLAPLPVVYVKANASLNLSYGLVSSYYANYGALEDQNSVPPLYDVVIKVDAFGTHQQAMSALGLEGITPSTPGAKPYDGGFYWVNPDPAAPGIPSFGVTGNMMFLVTYGNAAYASGTEAALKAFIYDNPCVGC